MLLGRIFVPTILGLTIGVAAQDFSAFPSACSSACGAYVKNSYLCGEQYPTTNGTEAFQACFCDVLSSADVAACAACLTTNQMTSAAAVVTATTATCATFDQGCDWQCAFPTCATTNITCQCSKSYLQNIYDCGSCNTNNNNVGKTQLTDYQSLFASCVAQKLASPNDAAKSTEPLPSPTITAYVAPSLTGNGVANSTVATTGKPTTATLAASIVATASNTASTTASGSYIAVSASALATNSSPGKSSGIGRGAVALGLLLSIAIV